MTITAACPTCKRTRTIYVDHTAGTVTAVCNGGCAA